MTTTENITEIELECRAGHSWVTERPKKGKWPKYCPEHRRFFFEQLSRRLKPPRRIVLEWNEQGQMLDDDEYTARWTKLWYDTVRLCGAMGGSWSAVDVSLVEKFVRATRMAELHRLYAQDRPYQETAHGSIKPHPGFELSQKEEARAKDVAVELGLISDNGEPEPKKRRNNSQPHAESAEYWNTRLQAEAEQFGDLENPSGPDGMGL